MKFDLIKKEKELVTYSLLAAGLLDNIESIIIKKEIIDFIRAVSETQYRVGNNLLSIKLQKLAINNAVLYNKHEKAVMYKELAFYLKNAGDYEEADKELNEAVCIFKDIHHQNPDPDLAEAYGDWAFLKRLQGDLVNALKYQKISLNMSKECLDPRDVNLGYSYGKYASILQEIGGKENLIEAEKKRLQANYIFKCINEKSSDYSSGLNNLALIYKDLKKYDLAIKTQIQAIRGYKESLPKEHEYIGIAYTNLAFIAIEKGTKVFVKKFLDYAKVILKSQLNNTHLIWAKTYYIYSRYYELSEDNLTALLYCEKAIDIYKTNKCSKHKGLVKCYELKLKLQ